MDKETQLTKQPSQEQQRDQNTDTVQQSTPVLDKQQSEHHTTHGGAGGERRKKITLLSLVFLIYFEVAGGAYGSEQAVRAAGPLFAVLGFLVCPLLWGVPEALVTAELAAALPGNGGFVLWADRAFGPTAGYLLGSWKYLSCVINIAAFPPLIADYVGRVAPAVAAPGGARTAAVVGMTVLMSVLNYTGLSTAGLGVVVLGFVSLAPFVVMTAMAAPRVRPRRWRAQVKGARDWRLFFNTLFWNLNYWDSASTMAGEVERPERTFPRALAVAVALIAVSYTVPLMAATAATDAPPEAWVNGYFADAAGMIGGQWLKYCTEIGAVLSTIGMYEAQLSSGAYQLLGMAELGLLPTVFSSRAGYFHTPWVGILISTAVTLAVSFLGFDNIVDTANLLYNLGTLLEFAAFLWLRARQPELKRPYRVPLPLWALAAMCAVPSVLLAYMSVLSGWRVFLTGAALTGLGVGSHCVMTFCRAKKWLRFNTAVADGGEVGDPV